MEFIEAICRDLGHATPGNFYVFTMDNLNSHKNPGVTAIIHHFGHGVVYRAPYYAVDGAIEYIFNTILTLLRARLHEIMTLEDLNNAILEIIAGIPYFGLYFRHVGFTL